MASIKKDLYHNTLGTIEKILDWGAFININGTQVKALNKDIFKDNTRIFEVFKEGDMIDNLKLKYVEKTALEVELNVKLNSPERGVKKEDLKKRTELNGKGRLTEFPATNKIAIASPIARPTPNTIAETIPDLALGKTTLKIVCI